MKTKDDDSGEPGVEKRPTMIVPGGDLDAVAKAADGRKAPSAAAERPPVDYGGFEAQRVMAPGGDLDAIALHAGDKGMDGPSGKPAGPVDPIRPVPAGDEEEMNYQDRGTFVDSGVDDAGARKRHAGFRAVQTPDKSTWRMGAQGFRFRDGGDEDPALAPGHFHDGKAEAEAPRRDTAPAAPYDTGAGDASGRKAFSHGSDSWGQFRSPAPGDAPQQRSGAPAAAAGEESALYLDVSTAQLEAVIRRIMERVFVEKVEAMLREVLENAVEKEMRNFRASLLSELGKSGGSGEGGVA
ncbi:hypothetical protein [Desulfococcus sp.]|uniref:hypothetical protein n=1 Tax=Desulfococcus sp. TaxID=2025834 RepID=UPI0035938663